MVEEAAGKPVSDIFVQDGEEAFRALERRAAARLIGSHPGVLALGGGAILDPGTREILAGRRVVYLETGFVSAVHRTGLDSPRPLLFGNPRARMKTLLEERLPVYAALAWITVPTDDREPADIARDIAARLAPGGQNGHQHNGQTRRCGQDGRRAGGPAAVSVTRIPVGGEHPYEVVVGTGVLGELPALVGKHATSVMVIAPEGLDEIARPVCRALADAGYDVHTAQVPAGEAAKDISVAAALWSQLAASRITRSDAIVGVGGGAATDLAGFVAATWLRGVRVVLVPTTLLAMTDAAVGGKTAVDIPEGKNLVGAFHPPAGVLADLTVLESLPRAEYVSGLAEVIKAGFIADPVILELIEEDPAGAVIPHGGHARELVERAVRMKADVVSGDLREAGRREILNYGHTLGHAIERVEAYQIRHGEAVAIGMVFAAEVARLEGRLDAGTAARHRRVLKAVGLPTVYRADVWPDLRDAMTVDKKARGARLRLVVLDGLARPGTLDAPAEDLLRRAYQEVCER